MMLKVIKTWYLQSSLATFDNVSIYKHEYKELANRNSFCGSVEMNLTSIHEDEGLIPGFTQWVKDLALP